MYGTKVPIDPRQIAAFARQIRLIDADGQASAVLPTEIHDFPADLANENLEFSGIYEDGWLGDEGFVVLSSNRPGNVVFRGMFPNGLGLDGVDLTLKVEDRKPIMKHLQPGPFELVAPADSGRSRIAFKFSAIGRLPSGDNRPATALLSSVSIESDGRQPPENPAMERLPEVIQGAAVAADGIFLDGWLAPEGFVVVNSSAPGKMILKGMIPGGIGLDDQQIDIANQTGETVSKKLDAGPFEVELPIQSGHSKLAIMFSRAANLPNGDGRSVSALLYSLNVVPRPE
jgi:hypothetical protein